MSWRYRPIGFSNSMGHQICPRGQAAAVQPCFTQDCYTRQSWLSISILLCELTLSWLAENKRRIGGPCTPYPHKGRGIVFPQPLVSSHDYLTADSFPLDGLRYPPLLLFIFAFMAVRRHPSSMCLVSTTAACAHCLCCWLAVCYVVLSAMPGKMAARPQY